MYEYKTLVLNDTSLEFRYSYSYSYSNKSQSDLFGFSGLNFNWELQY